MERATAFVNDRDSVVEARPGVTTRIGFAKNTTRASESTNGILPE
jgi:hypothetical protein